MTTLEATDVGTVTNRKPRDDEMDVYGLTHAGSVRKENQDHFLICSLRKEVVVHRTSLTEARTAPSGAQRVALLMMVADGVGGGAKGEEASRLAVEAVTQYVTRSMRCYYASETADDQEFLLALEEAAQPVSHRGAAARCREPGIRGMATTLTMWLSSWPRAFLLQVGDSRCYLLRQGELAQLTRDQTMAQELIDLGVLTPADASNTNYATTLSSSIGGRQTAPRVTRIDLDWGNVALLCSDGLTRHVSDERIRARLTSMTSCRQVCEDLLQDALDGGGTDNITIVVRRAIRSPEGCSRRSPVDSRHLVPGRLSVPDAAASNPALVKSTVVGTDSPAGHGHRGALLPAIANQFAVGGMTISGIAGLLFSLWSGQKSAGAAAGGGLVAGGVSAFLGILVSHLLGDVPASVLGLGTAGSAVTGAVGGLMGKLFAPKPA